MFSPSLRPTFWPILMALRTSWETRTVHQNMRTLNIPPGSVFRNGGNTQQALKQTNEQTNQYTKERREQCTHDRGLSLCRQRTKYQTHHRRFSVVSSPILGCVILLVPTPAVETCSILTVFHTGGFWLSGIACILEACANKTKQKAVIPVAASLHHQFIRAQKAWLLNYQGTWYLFLQCPPSSLWVGKDQHTQQNAIETVRVKGNADCLKIT